MSPADSEQGKVPGQGLADERELEPIALREHGAQRGVRPLAVEAGIDVGAAGQDEAVHAVEHLRRVLGAPGGEDERKPAPRLHGPDVVVAEAEDLALLARILDRDADGGPFHIRSGTGIPSIVVRTVMCRTNVSTTSVRKARASSLSA